MRKAVNRKAEEARARAKGESLAAEEESLAGDDRPPQTLSVRARSSGHGKKTADKWNQ